MRQPDHVAEVAGVNIELDRSVAGMQVKVSPAQQCVDCREAGQADKRHMSPGWIKLIGWDLTAKWRSLER